MARRPKPPALAGLAVLNVLLLGALAAITFMPSADAQTAPRSDYVAVPGTIAGSKTPSIWIVNETTQELVSIMYDAQRNELVGMGYRNLVEDARAIARSRN